MTNAAKQVRSERPPIYAVHPDMADDDAIITRALLILSTRVAQGPVCDSPRTIKDYLTVRVGRAVAGRRISDPVAAGRIGAG